jgi:hypothetical protein
VSTQQEMADFFSYLLKEDSRATIAEVINLSNSFPFFFNAKENQDLMEEVVKE